MVLLLNLSFLYTTSQPEMRKIIYLLGTEKNCTVSTFSLDGSSEGIRLFARVLLHWSVKYCISRGTEYFSGIV